MCIWERTQKNASIRYSTDTNTVYFSYTDNEKKSLIKKQQQLSNALQKNLQHW